MAEGAEALIQGRLNLPEEPGQAPTPADQSGVAEPVTPFVSSPRPDRYVSDAAAGYRASDDAVAAYRSTGKRIRMPSRIRDEIIQSLKRSK